MSNSNKETARRVVIDPEWAKALLDSNTHNRNIIRSHVELLKRTLINGEWKFNGDAIRVGSDGKLYDGQHRCIACVETGISFETLIIEGLDPETQITMDTGKIRTLAHMMQLRGEKNIVNLAALTTKMLRAEKFGLRAAVTPGAGGKYFGLTVTEQLSYLDANPWIRDLERTSARLSASGIPASLAGVLYFYLSNLDPDDADFFFARLIDGKGLVGDSPILALKDWLTDNRISAAHRGGRQANLYMVAAVTIKAWNKFRDGEPVKQLKFRTGGANPESFPEPR